MGLGHFITRRGGGAYEDLVIDCNFVNRAGEEVDCIGGHFVELNNEGEPRQVYVAVPKAAVWDGVLYLMNPKLLLKRLLN